MTFVIFIFKLGFLVFCSKVNAYYACSEIHTYRHFYDWAATVYPVITAIKFRSHQIECRFTFDVPTNFAVAASMCASHFSEHAQYALPSLRIVARSTTLRNT